MKNQENFEQISAFVLVSGKARFCKSPFFSFKISITVQNFENKTNRLIPRKTGYRRTEDRKEETELAFKMLRLPSHTTNR